MIRFLILAATAFLLLVATQGCTPTRYISYSTKDVVPEDTTSALAHATRSVTLDIEPFEDIRATVAENDLLFTRERETKVNEKDLCINSEEHYKKGTVPDQVATIMAKHLRKRAMFKNVVVQKKEGADYSITGQIKRLYGEQEVSSSAKVGSMFGLIGALATSGATTKGTVVIELANLVLHRNSDGSDQKLEDVTVTLDGELHADAYCWSIYDNVNDQLKIAVTKFAAAIEQAVGSKTVVNTK